MKDEIKLVNTKSKLHYVTETIIFDYQDELYFLGPYFIPMLRTGIVKCMKLDPLTGTTEEIELINTPDPHILFKRYPFFQLIDNTLLVAYETEPALPNLPEFCVYTMSLDTFVWEKLRTTENALLPHDNHCEVCLVDGYLYRVSKPDLEIQSPLTVHRLNLETKQWEHVPTEGQMPTASQRSSIVFNNTIYNFAKNDATQQIDLYGLNLENKTWKKSSITLEGWEYQEVNLSRHLCLLKLVNSEEGVYLGFRNTNPNQNQNTQLVPNTSSCFMLNLKEKKLSGEYFYKGTKPTNCRAEFSSHYVSKGKLEGTMYILSEMQSATNVISLIKPGVSNLNSLTELQSYIENVLSDIEKNCNEYVQKVREIKTDPNMLTKNTNLMFHHSKKILDSATESLQKITQVNLTAKKVLTPAIKSLQKMTQINLTAEEQLNIIKFLSIVLQVPEEIKDIILLYTSDAKGCYIPTVQKETALKELADRVTGYRA